MSTFRELRIREVLERSDDERSKVKEIQRLCQDDRIGEVASQEIRRLEQSWTTEKDAARRIDNEQEYWERREREEPG